MQVASVEGLEGLSIGRLATELGVSKSGLFAHFGSKTDLQLATVDAAREIFLEQVIGGSRRRDRDRVAAGARQRLARLHGAGGLPRRLLLRRGLARVRQPARARSETGSPRRWASGCSRSRRRSRTPRTPASCPRRRERAARLRDQRARHGRQLVVPALPGRGCVRAGADGDSARLKQLSPEAGEGSRRAAPATARGRRGCRAPRAARPDRQARTRAGGDVPHGPARPGARLAGQLARRPARAGRRRPRGAARRAGRPGRGDPALAERARGERAGAAARGSRRWSPIPPATSGSGSRTTTSASRAASTGTHSRASACSGC